MMRRRKDFNPRNKKTRAKCDYVNEKFSNVRVPFEYDEGFVLFLFCKHNKLFFFFKFFLFSLVIAFALADSGLKKIKKDSGLPQLRKVMTHEFTAPYSCKGSYEKSALFLSSQSQQRNSPDLLYNGGCGSQLYFQSDTAGDDMVFFFLLCFVALLGLFDLR